MADDRLRALERAAASGDVDAGERLIRERLRLGELDRERVALAAYLGHDAAERVVPTESPAELAAWLDGLARWGRVVSVRAAFAVARGCMVSLRPPKCVVKLVRVLPTPLSVTLRPGQPVVIGRDPACDVCVESGGASRRHCRIDLLEDGRVWLKDLGSKNGTYFCENLVDDVELSDGGLLIRVSSDLFEIRRSGQKSSTRRVALDRVQAWIDVPSDAAALLVSHSAGALEARGGRGIAEVAVRAATHAVLSHPSSPGAFLGDADPERVRGLAAGVLVPWSLTPGATLSSAPHAPLPVARAGYPNRWWRSVAELIEPTGLRPVELLRHIGYGVAGPIYPNQPCFVTFRAERPDGVQEVHTVVRGLGLGSIDPRWVDLHRRHIARLHAVGLVGDALVLREAHEPGETLMEWQQRAVPDPLRCARFAITLADALEEALPLLSPVHIEQRNIRVRPAGSPVWVGLAAGQARYEYWQADLDPDGVMNMRLEWLPPEVVIDAAAVEAVSVAVYALGLVLYVLLTGRPPFLPTSAKVLLRILDDDPPPPSDLGVEIWPGLEHELLRALEKTPALRHSSPKAFAQALREACNHGA